MNSPITPRSPQMSPFGPFCHSILLVALTVWIMLPIASIRPEILPIGSAGAPSETCTAHAPVTDQCVEAGLRSRRKTLRGEAAFQARTPATHIALAETLNQQGDPNGAIDEYRAAIQLDSDSARAFLGMGGVFLDQHEWEQAEGALERAAQLNSESYQAAYWLGRSRMAQLKFHESQRAFKNATTLDSGDPEAFSNLGLAYMAQGQSEEAINALRHAIRLRPDFSEAHYRLELTEALKLATDRLVREAGDILRPLFRR